MELEDCVRDNFAVILWQIVCTRYSISSVHYFITVLAAGADILTNVDLKQSCNNGDISSAHGSVIMTVSSVLWCQSRSQSVTMPAQLRHTASRVRHNLKHKCSDKLLWNWGPGVSHPLLDFDSVGGLRVETFSNFRWLINLLLSEFWPNIGIALQMNFNISMFCGGHIKHYSARSKISETFYIFFKQICCLSIYIIIPTKDFIVQFQLLLLQQQSTPTTA